MSGRSWMVLVGVSCVFGAWGIVAPGVARTDTHKIEVRTFEAGYVLGKPGLKVRLTLLTGEAAEYRAEDAGEAETLLRMGDMFLGGRARMFAEMEGSQIRAVQVASGLAFRTAQ